jgi:hypothetical protein
MSIGDNGSMGALEDEEFDSREIDMNSMGSSAGGSSTTNSKISTFNKVIKDFK